jgi:hypothetical protein
MNVKELREVLEEADGILAAAGAKVQSREFRTFLDLLKGHDHRLVEDFLADLREHLNGQHANARSTGGHADTGTVTRYVQRLREVGTDKHAFDRLFDELSNDNRIGKDEADAIAHLFIGGRIRWPRKSDALRAISDWFAHEAYQSVKLKQVEKASRG